MCSSASAWPHVSWKMQRLGRWPDQAASASSKICTKTRPTSRRTHSSKIAHEEAPVLLAAHRARSDVAPLLKAAPVVPLDDGDELDELGSDLVAQKAVELQRLFRVGRVDGREDVEGDRVLFEQGEPRHHALEGRCAPFVDAIRVVHRARPVQAEANQEIMCLEKLAPLVSEGGAVGLKCVVNPLPWPRVSLLQADRVPEKREPHQRRLAALPAEGDLGPPLRLHVLLRVAI